MCMMNKWRTLISVFDALRVTAFVSVWDNSLTFLSFSGCLCLPLAIWFILSPLTALSHSASLSPPPLSLSVKMQRASEQTAPVHHFKSSSGVSKLDSSFVSSSGGCRILSVGEEHSGRYIVGFLLCWFFQQSWYSLADITDAWIRLGWYICYREMHFHIFQVSPCWIFLGTCWNS